MTRYVAALGLFLAACSHHSGDGNDDLAVTLDQAAGLDYAAPPDLVDVGPAPPLRLTIDALPDTMNGKLGYGDATGHHDFTVRVPTSGFTVDYYVAGGLPDAGSTMLDAASFGGAVELFASVPVLVAGTTIPVGENLAPHLVCVATPDPQGWPEEARFVRSCTIPSGAIDVGATPVVTVAFTGKLVGSDDVRTEDAITVEVAALTPELDPFTTEDVWLITTSRDLFDHTVTKNADGSFTVTSTYLPAGNGTPDLDEAFTMLGFASSNTTVSTAFRALFLGKVREQVSRIFGLDGNGQGTVAGARMHIYFEGDAGAPDAATWTKDGTFSKTALGGDADAEGLTNRYVGFSHIDPNNQEVEDNTGYGYGILTTAMARQLLGNATSAGLLKEFSPIDGTPLGLYAGDDKLVDPSYTPATDADTRHRLRWKQIQTLLQYLPMAVGSTICHEIGHSLGLTANGPPPKGLFGGVVGLSFAKSDAGDWHIDTPGLNVMQTGKVTDYAEVLTGGLPRFTQLEMAYLRRRLIVGVKP